MTDAELLLRARNAGIATEYYDWRGQHVDVPAETLEAILAVLEQTPELRGPDADAPRSAALGHDDGLRPSIPAEPAERQWGFAVQLYSIRSKESWGHGDLHDLAKLARWSAAELGAGFVLINPLHAVEPLPPISPSPYLPMTRLFTSPLYLRVEDILEYGALPAKDKRTIHELAAPLRAGNATADLIDRDAVWRGKRAALELISKVPLTESRKRAYEAFRAERGRDLAALVHLVRARRGTRTRLAQLARRARRSWPRGRRGGGRSASCASAEFHGWLQWQADEQLAAAEDAAKSAGMCWSTWFSWSCCSAWQ